MNPHEGSTRRTPASAGIAVLGLILALVWSACASARASALLPGQPEAPILREATPTAGPDEAATATETPAVGEAAPQTDEETATAAPPVAETTPTADDEAAPADGAGEAATATAAPAAETAQPPGETTPPASAEVSSPPPAARAPAPGGPRPAARQTVPLHPFRPAVNRARVVVIDPGHGGPEVGAAGAGVGEKNVNLTIALKLRGLLEEDGLQVVLTRDGDRRAFEGPPPEGYSATRLDLQTRIDIANEAQGDAFVSIHNNGSGDSGQVGTEVWYDGKRPWADFNRALAEQVLPALVEAIRGVGYPVVNRGLKEDSAFRTFRGRQFPIFVLGPPRTGTMTTRATQMPAILGETLFLSNAAEAQLLTRDDVLAAIAEGYREGLRRYFTLVDEGALAIPEDGLPSEQPNHVDLPPAAPLPGAGS
ncbi:MAG: N-acetylmuramoyl-L-alanine amidase [Chloroflexi bacterium]|nr:N-acetylmuramoyl-L-alanine amidase [Chloroflexota bacterium]